MSSGKLSNEQICELLVSVGAGPEVHAGQFGRTLAELDLDSLARTEIVSRLKDRFGVDVDEVLTEDVTPAGLLELVNTRLTGGVS